MNNFKILYSIGWMLFVIWGILLYKKIEISFVFLVAAAIVMGVTAFFEVVVKLEKYTEKIGYKLIFWLFTTIGSLVSIVQCNSYLGGILGFTATAASATYAVILAFLIVGLMCTLYTTVFTVASVLWMITHNFRYLISVFAKPKPLDFQRDSMFVGLLCLYGLSTWFFIFQIAYAKPYLHSLLEYADFHYTVNCQNANGKPVLFIGDGKGLIPVGEIYERYYKVVDCY